MPIYQETDVEEMTDIADHPDLVVLKFEDGSIVTTLRESVTTYISNTFDYDNDIGYLPPQVDYNEETCFDIIEGETMINTYIKKDRMNSVIFEYRNQRTCFPREYLQNLSKDNTKTFYKCLGRNRDNYYLTHDSDYYEETDPDYIRISLSSNFLVPYSQYEEALEKNAYMYRLTPTGQQSGRIASKSVALREEMSMVSGDHCQEGTSVEIYNFEAVELESPYKFKLIQKNYFVRMSRYNRDFYVMKNPDSEFYLFVPPKENGQPDMDIFNFFRTLEGYRANPYSKYYGIYAIYYQSIVNYSERPDLVRYDAEFVEQNIFNLTPLQKLFFPVEGARLTRHEEREQNEYKDDFETIMNRLDDSGNMISEVIDHPVENDFSNAYSPLLSSILNVYYSNLQTGRAFTIELLQNIRMNFVSITAKRLSPLFFPIIKKMILEQNRYLKTSLICVNFIPKCFPICLYDTTVSEPIYLRTIIKSVIDSISENNGGYVSNTLIERVLGNDIEQISAIFQRFLINLNNFFSRLNSSELVVLRPDYYRLVEEMIDTVDTFNEYDRFIIKRITMYDNPLYQDILDDQFRFVVGFKLIYNQTTIPEIIKSLSKSQSFRRVREFTTENQQFYIDNLNEPLPQGITIENALSYIGKYYHHLINKFFSLVNDYFAQVTATRFVHEIFVNAVRDSRIEQIVNILRSIRHIKHYTTKQQLMLYSIGSRYIHTSLARTKLNDTIYREIDQTSILWKHKMLVEYLRLTPRERKDVVSSVRNTEDFVRNIGIRDYRGMAQHSLFYFIIPVVEIIQSEILLNETCDADVIFQHLIEVYEPEINVQDGRQDERLTIVNFLRTDSSTIKNFIYNIIELAYTYNQTFYGFKPYCNETTKRTEY
jgi:hypothetical protein